MKCNVSGIDSLCKLFTSIVTYILFFVTVLLVSHNDVPVPQYLLGIPVISVCCYLIQTYCFQLWLYVLLHVVLVFSVVMVPCSSKEYRILYFVMLCIEMVQAVLLRRRNQKQTYVNVAWNLLAGICLIYMIFFETEQSGFAKVIYYFGIAVIIIYFVRFFLSGLAKLFLVASQSTSIPVKTILINISYLFFIFILLFALFAVIVRYSDMGFFVEVVLRLIGMFFFYIFTVIIDFFTSDKQYEKSQQVEQNITRVVDQLGETTNFAQITERILVIVGMSLAVCLIYMMVKGLIRLLANRFKQDTDTVVQLERQEETIKEVNPAVSMMGQVKYLLKGDNASKIRWIYKLKIRKYPLVDCKEGDTPSELAGRILCEYKENIDELTHIYEKARYSNEVITSTDVKKSRV